MCRPEPRLARVSMRSVRMGDVKLPGGVYYDVAHFFSEVRAVIVYEGLYVLVDMDPATGEWDLSGEPARPDEKSVLEELTASMKDRSVVTVTKE